MNDQPVKQSNNSNELIPIVGIGASAGGLKTLKEFFENVPTDSNIAYVVVLHLSPEYKSVLAEILQPHVKIPVRQVNKTIELEANNVYVIPPNANLNTIDTHLRLSKLEKKRSERAPIDHFFRTIAQSHKGQAIGVILTGTGSDGTLGMKEIKEKGGLTIVQDPLEAEYDGMPQSAISTGLIDLILPVKDIPKHLVKFINTTPHLKFFEKEQPEKQENLLVQKIFALIKAHTGRDFSRYKLTTLMRRLQRRMQIYHMEQLENYLDVLRKSHEEVMTLSDDFLINVTSFFRDKHIFEYLEKNVIPKLIKNKNGDEQIRIWSVGCATGEEAYSLAILLNEAMAREELSPAIQIFASDLHETSLRKARDGFFPGDIKADVNPERLARFFLKEDSGYRIRKELREQVIFTPHNLLSDPPFSRLDLIVCRNLLIYLRKDTQRDVLELFHYALCSRSYLVLGTSESPHDNRLFVPESKENAIYRRNDVNGPEPRLPVFPNIQKHFHTNVNQEKREEKISFGTLHSKLLERFGPPSLLVDREYQVLNVSERAGQYLLVPGGEPSRDLFRLIRGELSLELRSAIHSAWQQKKPIQANPVELLIDGVKKQVVMTVHTVEDQIEEGIILILFEESAITAESGKNRKKNESGDSKLAIRIHELDEELKENRQQMQSVIEEYETSREEMKASNEELQSANEELRSTLEELETSKEELQSVNEELTTLNQENRLKVEELSQLSDDLVNLLAATDIATLFLNRELRIMRYTPKIDELFNIRPADRGRPITDITNKLGYNEIKKDAEKVLDKLHTIEKEIKDIKGNIFLTSIRPYRSSDNRIDGVVITFLDITERKHVEEKIARSEERFRSITNTMFNMLYRMNPDWSEMIELQGKNFLLDTTKPDKRWMNKYIHPDDHLVVKNSIQKAIDKKEMFTLVHRVIRKDGTFGWISSRAIPQLDKKGEISEWIGAAIDITAQKVAEQQLNELNKLLGAQIAERSEQLKQNKDLLKGITEAQALSLVALKTIRNKSGVIIDFEILFANSTTELITRIKKITGMRISEVIPEIIKTEIFKNLCRVVETEVEREDEYFFRRDGMDIWIRTIAVKMGDGLVINTEDITIRKKNELELSQIKDELSNSKKDRYKLLFNSIQEGFCTLNVLFNNNNEPVEYRVLEVNRAFEELIGFNNIKGKRLREIIPDIDQSWYDILGNAAVNNQTLNIEKQVEFFRNKWYEIFIFRIEDENEKQLMLLFTDISKRKDLEMEIKRLNENSKN